MRVADVGVFFEHGIRPARARQTTVLVSGPGRRIYNMYHVVARRDLVVEHLLNIEARRSSPFHQTALFARRMCVMKPSSCPSPRFRLIVDSLQIVINGGPVSLSHSASPVQEARAHSWYVTIRGHGQTRTKFSLETMCEASGLKSCQK